MKTMEKYWANSKSDPWFSCDASSCILPMKTTRDNKLLETHNSRLTDCCVFQPVDNHSAAVPSIQYEPADDHF